MTTQQNAPLEGLLEATASPLDRNDLGRLAQMHSHCQALAESRALTDESARNSVRTIANLVATLLEALILDEAAHPDEGLSLIVEAVDGLKRLCHGELIAVEQLADRLRTVTTGEAAPAQPAQPAEEPQAPAPAAAAPPQAVVVDESPAEPDAPAPTAAPGEAYVSEPLVIDMDEADHLHGFIEESHEHMDSIETALLEVEQAPDDTGKINELFRPFHTIKGIAGFLNLRDVNRLTHEVETILDMARKGELNITSAIIDRIFAAVDLLKVQIREIQSFMAAGEGGHVPPAHYHFHDGAASSDPGGPEPHVG